MALLALEFSACGMLSYDKPPAPQKSQSVVIAPTSSTTPTPPVILPTPPTTLSLHTPSAAALLGSCFGPIVVESDTSDGTPSAVSLPATVSISGAATGELFASRGSDGSCGGPITALNPIQLTPASPRVSFFYQTSSDVTKTLTVSATGLGSANVSIPIVLAADHITLSSPTGQLSIPAGLCSQEFRVTVFAADGLTVSTTFQATISGVASATIYSDPQCKVPVQGSTVSFNNGPTASFYLFDQKYPETLSLTATIVGNAALQPATLNGVASARAVTQLQWLPSPLPTFNLGVCNQQIPLSVQTLDLNGQPFNPADATGVASITVTTTTGTGLFSLANDCSGASPKLTVPLAPGAASTQPIYYIPTTKGLQPFTIQAVVTSPVPSNVPSVSTSGKVKAVPTNVIFTGPSTITASVCSGPFQLQVVDYTGHPILPDKQYQIKLTGIGNGWVFSDSLCSQSDQNQAAAFSIPQQPGQIQQFVVFYLLDPVGDGALTLQATGGLPSMTGFPLQVNRQALQLDPGFNGSIPANAGFETLTAASSPNGIARAIVIDNGSQSPGVDTREGHLMLAGSSFDANGVESIALTRLDHSGGADPTFAGGVTTVTTAFGVQSAANAIIIQDTDQGRRFLVAGRTLAAQGGNTDFALARYTQAGALDTTFNDGVSPSGMAAADFSGGNDEAFAVSLMSDKSIIVAGTTTTGTTSLMAIAHFSANGQLLSQGTLDFGNGLSSAKALLVVPESGIDRIYVAGTARNASGDTDFALGCVSISQTNGKESILPDATIPGASPQTVGRALIDFGGNDAANAMTLQGQKILLAGYSTATVAGQTTRMAIGRVHLDGSPDTSNDSDPLVSFNGNGKSIIDMSPDGITSAVANAVGVYQETDGTDRIILVGQGFVGTTAELAVARLTSDGLKDIGSYTWDHAFKLGNSSEGLGLAIDNLDRLAIAGLGGTGSGQLMAARLLK